jgi:hypothetical protein
MAWLAVMSTGEVVRFSDQGERTPMGVWVGGCAYSLRAHQLCTLVTHLLATRLEDQSPYRSSYGRPPGMVPGMGYPGAGIGTGF